MKLGCVIKGILILYAIAMVPGKARAELFLLRWMEWPGIIGPSMLAKPEEKTKFHQVFSFDEHEYDEQGWPAVSLNIKEGDVIAYRKNIFKTLIQMLLVAKYNYIGYALFKYGHAAIVVKDPEDQNRLRLLSSQSFKGPNTLEDVDTLKHHSWDVYRLNRWDQVDKPRFYEFLNVVRQKAGKWYGYDFVGMFGLWNSNLRPSNGNEIGYSYTCATVILAALQYSGVELDAYQRLGLADIVTPLQLVSSKGRVTTAHNELPQLPVELEIVTLVSSDETEENS